MILELPELKVKNKQLQTKHKEAKEHEEVNQTLCLEVFQSMISFLVSLGLLQPVVQPQQRVRVKPPLNPSQTNLDRLKHSYLDKLDNRSTSPEVLVSRGCQTLYPLAPRSSSSNHPHPPRNGHHLLLPG